MFAPRAISTVVSTSGRLADWFDKGQGAVRLAQGDIGGIEAFLPGVGASPTRSGGTVSRANIVDNLTGFTEQGNRVAGAIGEGRIKLNVLGDSMFDRAYNTKGGTGRSPQAFQLLDQIYLRRGSPNLLSEVIHEGTHVLDELVGTLKVPYSVNPYAWEKRAFFYERQFQRASGGNVDFGTINEMLDFIKRSY
ncbi:hypothetical protein K2X85_16615 [bacterium]|nr:hypothetical protein [bacterium]